MSEVYIVYSYYNFEGDDISSASVFCNLEEAQRVLAHLKKTDSKYSKHWDMAIKELL